MRDSDTGDRLTGNPLHKVHLGVQLRTALGLDFGGDAHYVSEIDVPEREFDPATLNIERQSCKADAYLLVNARVGYRALDDQLEMAFSAFNMLDPLLDNDGHREHCFGQPLGTRAYATLTYRFQP